MLMFFIWLYVIAFFGFLIVAACSDAKDLRISNQLTLTMAVCGLPALALIGVGTTTMLAAALTGAATLVVGWTLFEFGWIGGGDVKLASAAAVWLGPEGMLSFVLATAIFGAFLAAAMLLLSRWDLALNYLSTSWRARLSADTISVPYALAIAPAGAVAIFISLPDLLGWSLK